MYSKNNTMDRTSRTENVKREQMSKAHCKQSSEFDLPGTTPSHFIEHCICCTTREMHLGTVLLQLLPLGTGSFALENEKTK